MSPIGADLGQRDGIGRGKRHAEGVGGFTGTLATTLVRLTNLRWAERHPWVP
jgi:hypothetical protein